MYMFKPKSLCMFAAQRHNLSPARCPYDAVSPSCQKEDLSSLNFILTGDSSCPAKYFDGLQEKAGKAIDFRQGYSLTEVSAVAMFSPTDMPTEKRYKSTAGVIVPGCRARVVDLETGRDLGPGKPGEILFQGPHVMTGYLNNEEATRETLDTDGWLRTGDIGYYDEDEYFFILDRTKDLIKVKSLQVAPTELENIILELPEISEAAVVGVPDDRCGELPLAFVVPTKGEKVDPAKVISYVNQRVARHKQLAAGVRVIDQIPKPGKFSEGNSKNSSPNYPHSPFFFKFQMACIVDYSTIVS